MDFSIGQPNQMVQARPAHFWNSPLCQVGIASAVVLGLVIFLYFGKNRAGKTAWLKHKHALEAKGEILGWQAYIPEPIPDAQNIFAAPGISDSFVRGGSARMTSQLNPTLATAQRPLWQAMPVAELTVVLTGQPLPATEPDLDLYYDAPNLRLAGNGDDRTALPAVVPLIVMDEVPLRDAIRNLANAANIQYSIAPEILPHDTADRSRQATVSVRWENVTAVHALKEILKNYQLALVKTSNGGPARIIQQDPARPKVFISPEAREKMSLLAGQALGPLNEARTRMTLKGAQGYTFFKAPLNPLKPVHILVRAEVTPDLEEIAAFFPGASISGKQGEAGPFEVRPLGSNTFRATISPRCFDATGYLEWSDQAEPAFASIREALKRPFARMDGNYEKPFNGPMQNFVFIRMLAQTLAQRAQCCLLLDEPEDALRELSLLHDIRRLLEPRRSTDGVTVVAAMINVAVRGLYVDVISDGLRLHAWKEPQLVAMEKQLGDVQLLPVLAQSLRTERAAMCTIMETTPPAQIPSLFNPPAAALGQKIRNPHFWLLTAAPRGWVYENMVTVSSFSQTMLESYDPKLGTIRPRDLDTAHSAIEKKFSRWSPTTFLAAMTIPNFTRAWQTAASSQTKTRQALLACALERYWLTRKTYPKTLPELVPAFLPQLPVDVITGENFRYTLKDKNRFLLYSLGWNEKDDGGVVARSPAGDIDPSKGDWVWQPDQPGGS